MKEEPAMDQTGKKIGIFLLLRLETVAVAIVLLRKRGVPHDFRHLHQKRPTCIMAVDFIKEKQIY